MTSESLFLKRSTARTRLSTVAVAVLLAPAYVSADILQPMVPEALEPGDFLSYPVQFKSLVGKRVQLRVENGPENARLTVESTGQLRIVWQSPREMRPSTNIYVVARDVDTGQRLESKVLMVTAAEPMSEVEPRESSLVEPNESVIVGPREPSVKEPVESLSSETRAPSIIAPSENLDKEPRETVVTESNNKIPNNSLMDPVPEQEIEAEVEWEWIFELDPGSVELSAGGLPPGAMFMNDAEKGYVIRWTPTLQQQGRYEVSLQVVDRLNRSNSNNSSMRLEVKPKVIPTDFEDPDTPKILPIANQVVSAGRIISFKVDSTAEEGTKPVLIVDRIPRDASFDANDDGSRTFYWQTGDRDQGEHLFRFTAVNPREPNLRSFKDVLIVVGDPTRNKTEPQQ